MENNPDIIFKKYHDYLLQRSTLGSFYRNNFLYPLLNKSLYGKVLDIGCGIGDFCSFREATVGIDINPYNVKSCLERKLECYTITENSPYPFNSGSFSGAILDNVLEHVEHPQGIIKEINRVLKKDATLIVGVPGLKGFDSDDDHVTFYNEEKLVKTFSIYGFTHKKTLRTPLPIEVLSKYINQFCYYGIFKKTENK